MRSLSSALLISLPLILSLAGCSKKDQSPNQPAPASAAAQPTSTASGSQPQTLPLAAAQSPVPQSPASQSPAPQSPTLELPVLKPIAGLPRFGVNVGPVSVQFGNTIAGNWRGNFATWKWEVTFHFNEDGSGSVEIPALNGRAAASVTLADKQVTISAAEDTFKGILEGGKITGRWTNKGGSSDALQLTKE